MSDQLEFKIFPKGFRAYTVDEDVELSATLVNKTDETVSASLTVKFPEYIEYTTNGGFNRHVGTFSQEFQLDPSRQKPIQFNNITHNKDDVTQTTIEVIAEIGDMTYSETLTASLYL